MSVSSLSVLWGVSNMGNLPWFQYDAGEVKEASYEALDFLHRTRGLHGLLHDQHGYIVDMDSWSALVQYVQWCEEQKTDFLFHWGKVHEDDPYYLALANAKLNKFLARW